MQGEQAGLRAQMRGYIFEAIILELMIRSGFVPLAPGAWGDRVRERRDGFIEMRGRGCWHQIDCPCEYQRPIPFLYPLRLIGEVKFYKGPLEKRYIREFIGVLRDIQENYFAHGGGGGPEERERRTEVGVYFSANGFQREAEKLAYAHGIQTISYENNYLVGYLKRWVETLERSYLSVSCLRDGRWGDVKRAILEAARGKTGGAEDGPYWAEGYQHMLSSLRDILTGIQASLIATTETGTFLHVLGEEKFPGELFQKSDQGRCRVYSQPAGAGSRYFWLEMEGDLRRRRFYFTPPGDLAANGAERPGDPGWEPFHTLNLSPILNGISRNLTLRVLSG